MPWKHSLHSQISALTNDPSSLRFQPNKVRKSSAPLLFIGLGGTGLRIGKRTREVMLERFEPAPNPIPGMEGLPPYTRFLGIDTDQSSWSHFGYSGAERCDISNCRLTPENRSYLPTYITEWLNPVLVADGVHGALGVRQIGRFALFTHIDQIVGMLHEALQQVQGGEGVIQVFIASSTCGGTGSGIFLDVTYLLRHIAKVMGVEERLSVTALLTMPDLYGPLGHAAQADQIFANGYASLKELDYWMETADPDAALEQRYSPSLTIKWNEKPFDECFLLGSSGLNYNPHEYLDQTLPEMVAEYIAALFAVYDPSPFAGFGSDAFLYQSYRANISAALATMPRKFDVCRRYTTLGVCSRSIPMEHLFLTRSAALFEQVQPFYTDTDRCTPDFDGAEIKELIRRVTDVGITALFDSVQLPSPTSATPADIRHHDQVPHDPHVNAALGKGYRELEQLINSKDVDDRIRLSADRLEKELAGLFTNLEKGPAYASRLISGRPGRYDPSGRDFEVEMVDQRYALVGALEEMRTRARATWLQAKNTYEQSFHLAQETYHTITRSLLPPMTGSPKMQRYYAVCADVQTAMRDVCLYQALVRLFDTLLNKARTLGEQVFHPLCITLMETCKMFDEIKLRLNSSEYQNARARWNIIDPDELAQLYDSRRNADERWMIQALFDDMMRPYLGETPSTAERWLNGDLYYDGTVGIRLTENLQRVLNKLLENIKCLSMDDVFRHCYPMAVMPDGSLDLNQFLPQLMNDLSQSAVPMFQNHPMHPITGSFSSTLQTDFITATDDVSGMLQLPPHTVHANRLKDRIVWLRHIDGVSLYHYGWLENCERAYLSNQGTSIHRGLHLYENENLHWRNLPNLLPGAARQANAHQPMQQTDSALTACINELYSLGGMEIDRQHNRITLYFFLPYLREEAAQLIANARSIHPAAFRSCYSALLSSREKHTLSIDQNILSNYQMICHDRDPLRQLIYDMLAQRPALVRRAAQDLPILSALKKAEEELISRQNAQNTLMEKAVSLADLLAFGILVRPTPVTFARKDGEETTTVYNVLRDTSAYIDRYPTPYAGLVRVAAKLIDMEDPAHAEHEQAVRLAQQLEELNRCLKSGDPAECNRLVSTFQSIAPELVTTLHNQMNMLMLMPPNVKMSRETQRECMDFMKAMLEQLQDRADMLGVPLG